MLPFKNLIVIQRNSGTPLYIQISNEMIKWITRGVIPTGYKLLGGRKMSTLLGVSRRTVILAYEELEAQGWIEIKQNQGSFISSKIPITKKQVLINTDTQLEFRQKCGFKLNKKLSFLNYYSPPDSTKIKYVIDTGYPDVRIAPLKSLSQNLSSVLNSKQHPKILNYASDFKGHNDLRKELVNYLSETRGIKVSLENVMLTRGSLMAFSNLFQVLLEKGDSVVMGDVSFKVASNMAKIAGANILTVPVDDHGIDVNALEQMCKKKSIRAVFVMPHHHHPTTVSLCAERRMKLLMLAKEYEFAIIEDDYDYDFHYSSNPILPMASADHSGSVIYVGSLSKIVAPGLRVGFIVAPEEFIEDFARLSRFIDCHGNTALEKALAILFKDGLIKRHLKKSLKTYHARRDQFCAMLNQEIGDFISFNVPEGGLAVWVYFDERISLPLLREKAMKKGLLISRSVFQSCDGNDINAIRMGFASLNDEEMKEAIGILKKSVLEVIDLPNEF